MGNFVDGVPCTVAVFEIHSSKLRSKYAGRASDTRNRRAVLCAPASCLVLQVNLQDIAGRKLRTY